MDESTVNAFIEWLLATGWRLREIERLMDFRARYVHSELDQAEPDMRHLEFVRWLVLKGRLQG